MKPSKKMYMSKWSQKYYKSLLEDKTLEKKKLC